jgi:hypothetical protein
MRAVDNVHKFCLKKIQVLLILEEANILYIYYGLYKAKYKLDRSDSLSEITEVST